jgi:hypothetical protein
MRPFGERRRGSRASARDAEKRGMRRGCQYGWCAAASSRVQIRNVAPRPPELSRPQEWGWNGCGRPLRGKESISVGRGGQIWTAAPAARGPKGVEEPVTFMRPNSIVALVHTSRKQKRRKGRKLPLAFDPHTYVAPGKYRILINSLVDYRSRCVTKPRGSSRLSSRAARAPARPLVA